LRHQTGRSWQTAGKRIEVPRKLSVTAWQVASARNRFNGALSHSRELHVRADVSGGTRGLLHSASIADLLPVAALDLRELRLVGHCVAPPLA